MNLPSSMRFSLPRLFGIFLVGLIILATVAIGTGRVACHVTNGVSMSPTYHTGDLVMVAQASSYHTGQVVAYHGGPGGHLVVLHRIIGGNARGWVMKGDNNQSIDPTHPTTAQVIGRVVLHIPKVGAALTSPITRDLLLGVVLVIVGALLMNSGTKASARRSDGIAPLNTTLTLQFWRCWSGS